MNKYAAEKIAHDYYNMGLTLALEGSGVGRNKTANAKQKMSKKMLAALGLGGVGAGVGTASGINALLRRGKGMPAAGAVDDLRIMSGGPSPAAESLMSMPKGPLSEPAINEMLRREAEAVKEYDRLLGRAPNPFRGGPAGPASGSYQSQEELLGMSMPKFEVPEGLTNQLLRQEEQAASVYDGLMRQLNADRLLRETNAGTALNRVQNTIDRLTVPRPPNPNLLSGQELLGEQMANAGFMGGPMSSLPRTGLLESLMPGL
jgi:hypothetical protein